MSARTSYRIGLLLTQKNGDYGIISETERSCAALISSVHTILDSFSQFGSEHSHGEEHGITCAGDKREARVEDDGSEKKVTAGIFLPFP